MKWFDEVSLKHLPDLRYLVEIDVDEKQYKMLLNTLETLTKYVHQYILANIKARVLKIDLVTWRKIKMNHILKTKKSSTTLAS